jgi:rhodanese-related sulfurtransferase/DNA-binding transcriptional ArsR family regulator
MRSDAEHRAFKGRLYEQFARVGKTLASPHRLELLELLAQGERTVESLANETGSSMANTSQHLQALRAAGLVESRKQGLFVHYQLADPSVSLLLTALRTVAERQLADLDRIVKDHFGDRADPEPVSMKELVARLRSGEVVVLDTRPATEYAAGHIAGAVSAPINELKTWLKRLPNDKAFVAYCRGPYCIYADRAVKALAKRGLRAQRLRDGFPEWKSAGFPVETGTPEGTL